MHPSSKPTIPPIFAAGTEPCRPVAGAAAYEREALARRVVDAIHAYRSHCPQFLVFYPIDDHVELSATVASLIAHYFPAGALPGDGARLWRRLVQASTAPDAGDYYRVFEDLDAFELWVVTSYAVARTGEKSKRQHAAQKWQTPTSTLKDTPQRVYDEVGTNPRKATAISRTVGIADDHGRAILSGLCKLGLIRHVRGGGYVRCG